METIQKAILGFALVIALSVGTVFASALVTNNNPLDYASSITVPNNAADNLKEMPETQESAQLTNLAKITAEQAKAIALNEMSGTVNQVELDNENGNVVYSVEIMNNKKSFDVKIDAGNGKVLKVESGTEDGLEERKSPETESEKNSDFEQDGIDHQFEGDEGNHED